MTDGHVREYVKRVASVDLENYPEWDISVIQLVYVIVNNGLRHYIKINIFLDIWKVHL